MKVFWTDDGEFLDWDRMLRHEIERRFFRGDFNGLKPTGIMATVTASDLNYDVLANMREAASMPNCRCTVVLHAFWAGGGPRASEAVPWEAEMCANYYVPQ